MTWTSGWVRDAIFQEHLRKDPRPFVSLRGLRPHPGFKVKVSLCGVRPRRVGRYPPSLRERIQRRGPVGSGATPHVPCSLRMVGQILQSLRHPQTARLAGVHSRRPPYGGLRVFALRTYPLVSVVFHNCRIKRECHCEDGHSRCPDEAISSKDIFHEIATPVPAKRGTGSQ